VIERKTTADDLRRLLLIRLENYRATVATCPGGNRWYFVARIEEVMADLARLSGDGAVTDDNSFSDMRPRVA